MPNVKRKKFIIMNMETEPSTLRKVWPVFDLFTSIIMPFSSRLDFKREREFIHSLVLSAMLTLSSWSWRIYPKNLLS